MRNTILVCLAFIGLLTLVPAPLKAQVPAGIPYQAVARDASGNLLVSQPVGLRFSILSDNPTPGTVHYRELHNVTTTDLGQINVSIGSGTVVSGLFTTIPWSDSNVRLHVEMDPSGGTAYSVSGFTVFGTVPYAFQSGSSSLSGNGVPNGTAAGQTLRWTGSAWEASSNLVNTGSKVSINTGSSTLDLTLNLGDDFTRDGGIIAKGQLGTGAYLNTTGSGTRMMWYPRKAAFRAGHVFIAEWNDVEIGDYSFAGGGGTVASGLGSVAIGTSLVASGQNAVAFGGSNTSSGWNSFSAGLYNQSTGFYSSTLGRDNIASAGFASAFGNFNIASGVSSLVGGTQSIAAGQNAFAFGYGDSAMGTGAVALGYNSKVTGDAAFAMGIGNRAFGQGSIAIGQDNQAQLNNDVVLGFGSIAQGGSSFAVGYFNRASDDFSIAMGAQSLASGYASIAMGYGDTASASDAVAIGKQNDATGPYAVAIGVGSAALGNSSITIGSTNSSSASTAVSIGNLNLSSGESAVSIGSENTASALYASAIGSNTLASGESSFALGRYTISRSYGETSLGLFNTDYSPSSSSGFSANDRLFSIGNGTGTASRSNALVVLKSGNVGIGDNTPADALVVGNGEKFSVNSAGDINRIKNLNYAWPASYTAASLSYLQNDGSGNLSWMSGAIGSRYGGTGLNTSSAAAGSMLFTSGIGNWSVLPPGTSGQILSMVAGSPTWISNSGQYLPFSGGTMSGNITFNNTFGTVYKDAGTKTATILAPSTIGSSYTLTLPSGVGSSGQVLSTNGTGVLSWATPTVSASAITGTLGTSSLPSTLAYKNSSNVFTQGQFINASATETALTMAAAPGQTAPLTLWFDATGSGVPAAYMSNDGTLSTRGIDAPYGNFVSDASGAYSPLRIWSAATQFDPLTEWRSSTGAVLATVSATGVFTGNGSGLSNVIASSSTPVGGDLSGTIGNAQLATASVGTAEISDGSIATSDLANGSVSTAKLADNSVSGSKLAMGSDAVGDMLVYNGTDYVRLGAGSEGQVLKMSAGIPTWSNPTGIISSMLSLDGTAITPTSTTSFLSPTVSVTITNSNQKVLLDVSCALGAGALAGSNLNIYPAYKLNSATTVSTWGGGIFGLTCPVNTRQIYSVTASIFGLVAGTYQVGMAGSGTNFTNNEYCYVRAVVVN